MAKLKCATLILFVLTLSSCSFSKKPKDANKSAKQMYEEYLDINIKRCVQALVDSGNDPEASYQWCKYALDKAYKIDSTFFKMNPDEVHKFLEQHMDELNMDKLEK